MTTSARERYQPSPLAKTETHQDGDKWRLVFVRHFSHAPNKVWQSITRPEQLREWAPFDANRDLGTPGPVTLTMAGAQPQVFDELVTLADPPRRLEYTWGGDTLRWELERTDEGTRLTLQHTVADRSWLSKVAAGWHICFDVMAYALDGDPIGRIVAEGARQFGWDSLNAAYQEKLAPAAPR